MPRYRVYMTRNKVITEHRVLTIVSTTRSEAEKDAKSHSGPWTPDVDAVSPINVAHIEEI